MTRPRPSRRPLWVWLLTAAVTLWALSVPLVYGPGGDEWLWLMKLYPAYALGTGICAIICWAARRDIYWILLAILCMANISLLLI